MAPPPPPPPVYEDDPYHGIVPNPDRKRNPAVLVGAVATAGVLAAGLIAFRQGNQKVSQAMMRARVAAQAATVALMLGSTGMYAMGKGDGGDGDQR